MVRGRAFGTGPQVAAPWADHVANAAAKAPVALHARTAKSRALSPDVFSRPCMNATLGESWAWRTSSASAGLRVNVRSGSPGHPADTGPGPVADHEQLHCLGAWAPDALGGRRAPALVGPAPVGRDRLVSATIRVTKASFGRCSSRAAGGVVVRAGSVA